MGDLNLIVVDDPVAFHDAPDAEVHVHRHGFNLGDDGQDGLEVFDVSRYRVQLNG